MATPVSGANTWLTLNGQPLSFDPTSENLTAGIKDRMQCEFERVKNSGAPRKLTIRVEGVETSLKEADYGVWPWKLVGYAGLYQIEVSSPDLAEPLVARVRVVPGRGTYLHYRYFLNSISNFAVDLLFELNSPAEESMQIQLRKNRSSALREYRLIKDVVKDLLPVVEQIRRSPHRVLSERDQGRLLQHVPQFSSETVPIPGPTLTLQRGNRPPLQLPQVWNIKQGILTHDVYENRLVKHFLQKQLLGRINAVQTSAERELVRAKKELEEFQESKRLTKKHPEKWDETIENSSRQVRNLRRAIADCKSIARQTITWASEPFLKDVHSLGLTLRPSQVLQKHSSYSRFYHIYLGFAHFCGRFGPFKLNSSDE